MTSVSGTCAAILGALTFALVPAGAIPAAQASRAAGVSTVRSAWAGYPDLRAALPAGLAAASPAAANGRPSAVRNVTSTGSLNWAGYAVSKHKRTFRLVRATFFVPYLTCAGSPGRALSSEWVGLDGYVGKPDSVEQVGIAANCSAASHASYSAWFEMFPYPERKLPTKIHAGDSVTVQVTYDSRDKDFRLSLTDNTRGEHVSKLRKCPGIKVSGKRVQCPRTSAEVIAEAPAIGTSSKLTIAPLADYGAISLAGVSVTDNSGQRGGIISSHWSATKIIQVRKSGGPVLAQPTSVHADTFDDYWLRED